MGSYNRNGTESIYKSKKINVVDDRKESLEFINGVYNQRLQGGLTYEFDINNKEFLLHVGDNVKPIRCRIKPGDFLVFDLENVNPQGGSAFIQANQEITFGRGSKYIGENEMKISRNHVKIKYLGNGRVLITDLNSTNGTWVSESKPKLNIPKERINTKGKLNPNVEYYYNLTEQNRVMLLLGQSQIDFIKTGNTINFFIDSDTNPFVLNEGDEPVIIGRSTLPFMPPSVSRNHLSVQFKHGYLIVKDLDSSHGTEAFIVK